MRSHPRLCNSLEQISLNQILKVNRVSLGEVCSTEEIPRPIELTTPLQYKVQYPARTRYPAYPAFCSCRFQDKIPRYPLRYATSCHIILI